MSDIST